MPITIIIWVTVLMGHLGCKPKSSETNHTQLVLAATKAGISDSEAHEMADLALHSENQKKTPSYFASIGPLNNAPVKGMILLTSGRNNHEVRIVGWIHGLVPGGIFGFHVNEGSRCDDTERHFNPTGRPHGNPTEGDQHHLGDLPNIQANQSGVARVDIDVTGINLTPSDPSSIINRTLVIHRDPDDFKTQPSGNSGPINGCGVVKERSALNIGKTP